MSEDSANAPKQSGNAEYDSIVQKYEDYLESPLGWLRDALIWQQLAPRLGEAPLRILDAGCGPGVLALRLAAQGHTVWAIDSAPDMISRAQQRAQEAPAAVQGRVAWTVADVGNLSPPLTGRAYDAILCHNVLEYLPDPARVLRQLGALLAPEGGLSVVVANRASLPLKAAVAGGDLRGALDQMTMGIQPLTLLGVPKRTFSLGELAEMWASAGLVPEIVRPIRVIADLLPPALLADEAQRPGLLALETALAEREEYRAIGRMTLVWGRRARA